MTEQTCAHCTTRPVRSATICSHCTRTLEVAVANIGAYVADLDTVRTRSVHFSARAPVRRGGGPMPLPVDQRFTDQPGGCVDDNGRVQHWGTGTDLAWVARNTITTWTRVVLEERPPLTWHGPVCAHCLHRSCNAHRQRRAPADNLVSCCHYLHRQLPHMTAALWVPELLDQMLDLERCLAQFLDRPPGRWYAGPCTAGLQAMEATWLCGAELYAVAGKDTITCPECGLSYTTKERRDWLLAAAEDRWETATTIALAVTVLGEYDSGETRLVKRINRWVKDGRLARRGHAAWGERTLAVYRVGDVVELVREDNRKAMLAPHKGQEKSRTNRKKSA